MTTEQITSALSELQGAFAALATERDTAVAAKLAADGARDTAEGTLAAERAGFSVLADNNATLNARVGELTAERDALQAQLDAIRALLAEPAE